MIKATEIRIGNILKEGTVFSIEFDPCVKKYYCYFVEKESPIQTKSLNPIPLTEERLIKFGFQKDGYDYWVHNEIYFELRDLNHGNYCLTVNCGEYNIGKPIQYVHQLQNLFFSLTGTELIYKP